MTASTRGERRLPRRRRPRGERRRAVYLLPNLMTTASLMLGFWSITQSIQGRWDRAAWGIVLAGIAMASRSSSGDD